MTMFQYLFRFVTRHRRSADLSAAWLRAQRQSDRVEFYGTTITWPIDKAQNEASAINRVRLRADRHGDAA